MTDTFKNTSNFLNKYSERIWNRIRLSRSRKHRISETTITENLIFDFWCHAKEEALAIEIYEAKDEKSNGNDLEIYIETKRGFLMMACQAKILDKFDRYAHFNHKVGDEHQIDLLIKYGRKMGALPCYLLYNYVNYFVLSEALGEYENYEDTCFGLTCCNAEFIKENFFKANAANPDKIRVSKPKFKDLHPLHAVPLAEQINMFCDDNLAVMLDDIGSFLPNKPIKFYSRDQITDSNYWEGVLPNATIGFVETRELKQLPVKKELKYFKPKYRILLTREVKISGLFMLS